MHTHAHTRPNFLVCNCDNIIRCEVGSAMEADTREVCMGRSGCSSLSSVHYWSTLACVCMDPTRGAGQSTGRLYTRRFLHCLVSGSKSIAVMPFTPSALRMCRRHTAWSDGGRTKSAAIVDSPWRCLKKAWSSDRSYPDASNRSTMSPFLRRSAHSMANRNSGTLRAQPRRSQLSSDGYAAPARSSAATTATLWWRMAISSAVQREQFRAWRHIGGLGWPSCSNTPATPAPFRSDRVSEQLAALWSAVSVLSSHTSGSTPSSSNLAAKGPPTFSGSAAAAHMCSAVAPNMSSELTSTPCSTSGSMACRHEVPPPVL
eukprot:m.141037 g.141037  ORF g.141037 m.141037 type:complete len:316 (-) comp22831_c0_seq1:645-1592(-)